MATEDAVGVVRMPLAWHGDAAHIRGVVWQTTDAPIGTAGHYSYVYAGEWQRDAVHTTAVALKMLRDIHAPDKLRKRLEQEIRVWSYLNHEFLLPLYGTCELSVRGGSQFYIVSPLMKNGNAMQFLAARPQADRLILLQQVASALVYLHTRTSMKGIIVHGDVKGENVLISDNGSAVLGDFGLATVADAMSTAVSSSFRRAGTERFKAPELLLENDGQKSTQSDVFAFGMLIYQLYSGQVPFADLNDPQFFIAISQSRRPERPEQCTLDHVWTTATSCWAQDIRRRPVMSQVFEWLANEATKPQRSIYVSSFSAASADSPTSETRTVTLVARQMDQLRMSEPTLEPRAIGSDSSDEETREYERELGAAKMQRLSMCILTVSQSRRLLDRVARSWKDLSHVRSVSIPFFHSGEARDLQEVGPREFQDGCFFVAVGNQNSRPKHLRYVELPSIYASADRDWSSPAVWKHVSVDEEIRDFTVDIEQDLLVFVEIPADYHIRRRYRIHIRQLSTGLAHPSAQRAVLECNLDVATAVGEPSWFYLQISRQYLAISRTLRVEQQEEVIWFSLNVWSWKDGLSRGTIVPRPGNNNFAIIGDGTVLVPNPPHGSLDVYQLQPDTQSSSWARVPLLLALRARFMLPTPYGYHYWWMAVDAMSATVPENTTPRKPFTSARRSAIISCTTLIRHGGRTFKSRFVARKQYFLDCIANARERILNVPWVSWGYKNTSWFQDQSNTTVRVTFGSRLALLSADPRSEDRHIRILNFNDPVGHDRSSAVRDSPDRDESRRTRIGYVDPVQNGSGLFKPDGGLVPTLPYIESVSRGTYEFAHLYIDDERLIGLERHADGRWIGIRVMLVGAEDHGDGRFGDL